MCGHGSNKEEARKPERLNRHFLHEGMEGYLRFKGIKAQTGMIDGSRNQ